MAASESVNKFLPASQTPMDTHGAEDEDEAEEEDKACGDHITEVD